MLAAIVDEFDGDRHLSAVLRATDGAVIRRSVLLVPAQPAPSVVFDLVGGRQMQADIALPATLQGAGQLLLETDAHNEVAEAWGDLELALFVMTVFFCLILALTMHTLRRSLRPLQDLSGALGRIGMGDYDTRLAWPSYRELAPVQQGFNAMGLRLAEMDMQNRVLATRMQCVQEDERSEIARDLHDEVAPFLFAVSADAALIRDLAARGTIEGVQARARGILDSVGHMQTHLRDVLQRLMPDVLLDLGLPGAVDALVDFWRARMPGIVFCVDITAETLEEADANVAFRVIQESLSNAVRHAQAQRIYVSVRMTGEGVDIEIVDDGSGLPALAPTAGLGVLGMRERVRASGGVFEIGNRRDGQGVAVHVVLAAPAMAAAQ
jgi:two-component system sensor histidine kinase UhpB